MKVLFFCILVFPNLSFSQKRKYENEIPPGTIEVSEDFFIDETEITNFHWLEYLFYLKTHFGDSSKIYVNALPDTSVYINFSKSDSISFFRNSKYVDYPIVGITYQQAVSFCNWRSQMVNFYIYVRDHKLEDQLSSIDIDSIELYEKFTYRLPKQQEWINCSRIPFKKKYVKKMLKNNHSSGNFRHLNSEFDIPLNPVFAYYPNKKGFYNIFGNVAELIQDDSTVVMGGSWRQPEEASKTYKGLPYDGASDWIGFRCVAVRNRE